MMRDVFSIQFNADYLISQVVDEEEARAVQAVFAFAFVS